MPKAVAADHGYGLKACVQPFEHKPLATSQRLCSFFVHEFRAVNHLRPAHLRHHGAFVPCGGNVDRAPADLGCDGNDGNPADLWASRAIAGVGGPVPGGDLAGAQAGGGGRNPSFRWPCSRRHGRGVRRLGCLGDMPGCARWCRAMRPPMRSTYVVCWRNPKWWHCWQPVRRRFVFFGRYAGWLVSGGRSMRPGLGRWRVMFRCRCGRDRRCRRRLP